ncbi:MAG: CAP domain-containing protein [Solirubrobacterales bacterium]
MRKTAIAAVLAMVGLLLVLTAQASACRGVKRPPSRQSIDEARRAVTCLINRRRAHRGLRRLRGSVALGAAAQGHSDAMAALNFFSHDGGDGTPVSRAQAAGYTAGARTWGIGEDLEWATRKASSPRAIVRGWMRSPEHRSVMFSRHFRHIGIGITDGSPLNPDPQNAAVFTADFGFRKG